jgi:hypothetical protein
VYECDFAGVCGSNSAELMFDNCTSALKETLLALVRDLFTFSSKVIQMFIIV